MVKRSQAMKRAWANFERQHRITLERKLVYHLAVSVKLSSAIFQIVLRQVEQSSYNLSWRVRMGSNRKAFLVSHQNGT